MGDPISGVAGALESFGRALVGWVVQQNVSTALLLVGALAFDRALARRARASLRVALYAPVALRVLLPLDWNLRIPSAPPVETIFAPLLVGARSALDAPSTLSWYALAAGLYVIGAILLAARAIVARVRLGRALVHASPVVGLDFDLGCAVMQHADLGPIAVGVLTPRIVVPRELLGKQNKHALACVLRHELAHLHRKDTWLSAAMLLLGIAAWPVIPVWIAIARVRQLVELACDENALEGAGPSERRRYGHVLLDIAESRSSAIATIGGGGLYFGSTLRARVEALAMQRHWPLGAQALALSLAPVVLFLACGGSAAPPVFGHVTTYGYEFAPVTPGQVLRAPAPDIARTTNPEGRLVPEAIENVVRGHSAAISSCYDTRYGKNAKPTGAVTVRYVIGEDGVTNDAFDDGSTLPDHAVVDCVIGVFRNLHYPASRDGKIAVIYPIQFGS
jgi:beta-lactamase regulating signal transducer with metallopeptidase domain